MASLTRLPRTPLQAMACKGVSFYLPPFGAPLLPLATVFEVPFFVPVSPATPHGVLTVASQASKYSTQFALNTFLMCEETPSNFSVCPVLT